MDEMEVFKHQGQSFLCSGEQLPSKLYHAVVRYRSMPGCPICTLVMGSEMHVSSWRALIHAKELAVEWAFKHPHPGYKSS